MHIRTLGQGLQVSAIGIGAVGMSQSYGPNPGEIRARVPRFEAGNLAANQALIDHLRDGKP